jgi:hypothetical protein
MRRFKPEFGFNTVGRSYPLQPTESWRQLVDAGSFDRPARRCEPRSGASTWQEFSHSFALQHFVGTDRYAVAPASDLRNRDSMCGRRLPHLDLQLRARGDLGHPPALPEHRKAERRGLVERICRHFHRMNDSGNTPETDHARSNRHGEERSTFAKPSLSGMPHITNGVDPRRWCFRRTVR